MKPNDHRTVSGRLGHFSVGDKERPGSGVPSRRAKAGRLTGGLLAALLLSGVVAVFLTGMLAGPDMVLGVCTSFILLGVATSGHDARIRAGLQQDTERNAKFFTLSFETDMVALFPGKTWTYVDKFKWCARGLVDEPHTFHILSDGTVEINSKKIKPADPAGVSQLELEMNKHHVATLAHELHQAHSPLPSFVAPPQAPGSARLRFRVKLDRMGHFVIEYGRGAEREETGLRGIPALITNGLLLKPDSLHVDPMQRAVEIDGVRFECSEAGAKHLEEALNTRYAANLGDDKGIAIEIKENLAANTRFDIHFMTYHGSIPFEIKGHLSQETLDILQDPAKCDLLQPGIQLRLAPPHLVIRRRRTDMGEDKIPEIPDINYLQISAMRLQQILNHPIIRMNSGAAAQFARHAAEESLASVVEMRLVRNPADKTLLWLESKTADGGARETKAFTHHNIAEMQLSELFLPHLDVCLSLDHGKLSILDRHTRFEDAIMIGPNSSDEVLVQASRMLTNALKPPKVAPVRPAEHRAPVQHELPIARQPVVASPVQPTAIQNVAKKTAPIRVEIPPPPAPAKPALDPVIAALFRETDPVRINEEIFRRLGPHFGLEVQEARFSRPMVFDDRRFEILNFEAEQIEDLMQLRDEYFYGFYLSHINERKAVLVYACNGTHIEWGPDKCMLQKSVKAEPEEYKGSALLGFAQDEKDEFVFIVQPAFKDWIKPRERHCADVTVFILTVAEYAAEPDKYKLVWPERLA
jgi:hypothetical protein